MSKLVPVEVVKVLLLEVPTRPILVGRLTAWQGKILFEYDPDFIKLGRELSPFHLPLIAGVQEGASPEIFDGLHGVFNDSLPDGWGRLLMDRWLRSQGIDPYVVTPLDRLVRVGRTALGALGYEPDQSLPHHQQEVNLERLAEQTRVVLDGDQEQVFEELLQLNGSSAGARPKALIGVSKDFDRVIEGVSEWPTEYDPWIVKFPNSQESQEAGVIEYVYSLMAREAGIEMPPTYLFPNSKGPGYFGVKRFDVGPNRERFHIHSVSGLLHANFRVPSLDYEDLLKVCFMLTQDFREVEKLFRLAVFNVLAHNRDDHSKNFAFQQDMSKNWRLTPAYDLTFSSGPGGEQSMMVMGEGRHPTRSHLLKLASVAQIKEAKARQIMEEVTDSLSNWMPLAKEWGVSPSSIRQIEQVLAGLRQFV